MRENFETWRAIGFALAKKRKSLGITQTELANKLRKSRSYVSACEKGRRRIGALEFIMIADAFNMSPKALMTLIRRAMKTVSKIELSN